LAPEERIRIVLSSQEGAQKHAKDIEAHPDANPSDNQDFMVGKNTGFCQANLYTIRMSI
jgi:hypothetical protein